VIVETEFYKYFETTYKNKRVRMCKQFLQGYCISMYYGEGEEEVVHRCYIEPGRFIASYKRALSIMSNDIDKFVAEQMGSKLLK
jgi:hypothetical protein